MSIDTPNLLSPSPVYKPFRYPWAFEAWKTQQSLHWLPEEIPLGDDVKDWNNNLSGTEKYLVTQIFRLFTQQDTEVENAYIDLYMPRFKPTEVRMMLSAFTNMESIHQAAYSHLLDTIGMPETEYAAFLEYEEMAAKHEFLKRFNMDDHYNTALSMAVFAGFTEGLQLFASFAMLLNFPRHNLMKGMGQVVTWSVRDESLHVESITRLFKTYMQEFGHQIDKPAVADAIHLACREIVENEDRFIDLAFRMGPVNGLTAAEVKQYIRFIANRRLIGLELDPIYDVPSNPLPWIDEMMNAVEHANFFENRATEYSRGATLGTWDEAFA